MSYLLSFGVFFIPFLQLLSASWVENGVTLSLPNLTRELDECVQGGIEVRLRYRYQLCGGSDGWGDRCKPEEHQTRFIRLDTITGRYQVITDNLGDDKPPQQETAPNLKDARRIALRTELIDVVHLAHGDTEFLRRDRIYIKAKVQGSCDGDRTILARVAEVVTLGLIEVPGIDTSWERFMLGKQGNLSGIGLLGTAGDQ